MDLLPYMTVPVDNRTRTDKLYLALMNTHNCAVGAGWDGKEIEDFLTQITAGYTLDEIWPLALEMEEIAPTMKPVVDVIEKMRSE